jgi:Zn-dependent M28 family amino/carboxypeptidase
VKRLALVACALAACGSSDGATIDAGAGDASGCASPALDAPWLRGLVGGVVTQLSQAPRATTTQRTTARTYVSDQLTAIGWSPMLHTYPSGANVYASIPATITTTHQIIVGAHFDSVSGSPGANDNATGVAAVLAIARYLHDAPCRNAAVTVILFDEEEPGLFGSRAYANRLSAQSADVIAVHTIDQIGWDADGDRRFEIELPTAQLGQEYAAAAGIVGVSIATTTTSGTDHQSFRDAGYSAVGLTEEYANGDTSPYRHTPQDTAATVNQDYLVLGTKLVAQVVLTELTR